MSKQNTNMTIYSAARECPSDALKKIEAGRLRGKSDINPMWRIKMLTELFGPCGIGWYYEITKQWLEQGNDEVAAFCNIALYVKSEGEWSKPIMGTGGSSFVAKEKNGPYVSDECFKMALTDALSVACKALGFAADVYWQTDSTKYSQAPQAAPPPQAPRNVDDQAVTKDQVEHIKKECQARCVDPVAICRMYNKEQFAQFTQKQFRHLMANWEEVARRVSA
jgi:hypothetical protein